MNNPKVVYMPVSVEQRYKNEYLRLRTSHSALMSGNQPEAYERHKRIVVALDRLREELDEATVARIEIEIDLALERDIASA